MTFHVPQPYICSRCQHEFQWSQDLSHSAPVFAEGPGCPKCYGAFLREHIGIGTMIPFADRLSSAGSNEG